MYLVKAAEKGSLASHTLTGATTFPMLTFLPSHFLGQSSSLDHVEDHSTVPLGRTIEFEAAVFLLIDWWEEKYRASVDAF